MKCIILLSHTRAHGHGRCHGHCWATELENPRVTGQLKKYIKSENGKKVTKIIQKGDLNHLFQTKKSPFLIQKITKKVMFGDW